MIFKSFEINKIDFEKNTFYLFYGENDGFKKEIIQKCFVKNKSKSLHQYDESQILNNKNYYIKSYVLHITSKL